MRSAINQQKSSKHLRFTLTKEEILKFADDDIPNPTIDSLTKTEIQVSGPPVEEIQNSIIIENENPVLLCDSEATKSYPIKEICNKVIFGDSFNVLKKIENECIDLVFMDPPYFLQLPKKELKRWNVQTVVDAVDDDWDKFASFEDYDNYIKGLLTEVRRVMKKNATIWIISTYHSMFRIGRIMQDLGFWVLNDVIWLKTNPMPNWLGVRFTNATETLIWAVRDKDAKKYTFDKEFAKSVGFGKIGANVWILPICNGSERIRNNNGEKLHSTQKPTELLKRVILSSSKEGDIILDPVAGSGTTGFVAKKLNRNFIMIEKKEKYVQGIIKRLITDRIEIPFDK